MESNEQIGKIVVTVEREAQRRDVIVPTMRFGWNDFLMTFGVTYVAGLTYLVVGLTRDVMVRSAHFSLIPLIVVALIFDYINGFHDAANSIATVVSTRVLTPLQAVVWAAFFNFVAAFGFGVNFAKTVGKGVVESSVVDPWVILAGLAGAIVWDLLTWYWGLPTSSSHALIGGFAGRLRGSNTITNDLDICYARDRANLDALVAALRELGATLRGAPKDIPFLLEAETLERGDHFTFETRFGDLDCLGTPSGSKGFQELIDGSTEISTDPGAAGAMVAELISHISPRPASAARRRSAAPRLSTSGSEARKRSSRSPAASETSP